MFNGVSSLREFGELRLDTQKKTLWHNGEPVAMPLKELDVLCMLVERPGELVTKDEILDRVWHDSFVEESNLSRHIYLLRKTLKQLGQNDDLIQNVPRRGYRFAGEVREVTQAEIVVEKHTQTRTLIEVETSQPEREAKSIGSAIFSRPLLAAAASIFVLAAGAFFGYSYLQPAAAASPIKSLAVLPFKTIGDADAHHGLGLTDVLVTRLSAIKEINVRPTSAILAFENQTVESAVAGRKLNVDGVLEGTMYREGGNVRITTRFIRVADNSTLWTGQYEANSVDELRLQNELAIQIADVLKLTLSGDEKQALMRPFTKSTNAYQLYVRGRYEWNKRTWAGMDEAERLFRNAIDLDPAFALAHVGLADSMLTNPANTDQATMAVQKALDLDPSLAEAHATLGFLKTFHAWQWHEAEASLKKSIEMNPNYATAHHWLAQVWAIQGRNEDAKAAMLRALEIDPFSHNFLADLGQIYYFERDYKRAEEYCRRALEINPDFAFARGYLADIYLQTGDYDRAVEEILAADSIASSFANQSVEHRKQFEEKSSRRRNIYREGGIKKFLESRIEERQDRCYDDAEIYAFIGQKEKALACLETAHRDRGFLTVFIKADPIFDPLRQEPRYREILRKMNLGG